MLARFSHGSPPLARRNANTRIPRRCIFFDLYQSTEKIVAYGYYGDHCRQTREVHIGVFRAGVVRSRPIAQDESFSPEDVIALANAFEDALRSLGLRYLSDPIVLSVASRIIELARHGERNPTRLRDYVVGEFQARSR
jgi:hypothetical protein